MPGVRDRIALRALADLLGDIFAESAGKIPQSKVAEVMKGLSAERYDTFVRIDVEAFYPSVDHDILLRELNRRIQKKEILRLLRRAIATPTAPDKAPRPRALLTSGIPQGLSISNLLAEIYMHSVDNAMSVLTNSSYYRFVDDILIMCSASDAQTVETACRRALADVRLCAHPNKAGGKSETGLIADGFGYLGYVFSDKKVSVRPESVIRLESHLAAVRASWRNDVSKMSAGSNIHAVDSRFFWHRNLAITGCVFQGVASGWIQYFRQLDDLGLLKRLDATVTRLGVRYGIPALPESKTFMRAYWAIRHPRSRNQSYIPNFDLYDTDMMDAELRKLGVDTSHLGTDEVVDTFYRMVSKAVRQLDRDIGALS